MSKTADKATTDVVKDIFEVVSLFEDGEEYFILPDYLHPSLRLLQMFLLELFY